MSLLNMVCLNDSVFHYYTFNILYTRISLKVLVVHFIIDSCPIYRLAHSVCITL